MLRPCRATAKMLVGALKILVSVRLYTARAWRARRVLASASPM